MNKTIDNLKSKNYEVVDNQGVSVTEHFTQCLEQEFADLEAKLAENEERAERYKFWHNEKSGECAELKQQLAEKEKESKDNLHHAEFWQSSYKRCIDRENQDKISFAVEKLTEIRDYVKNCRSLDATEGKVRLDIAKKIRLKIEELKGNENE